MLLLSLTLTTAKQLWSTNSSNKVVFFETTIFIASGMRCPLTALVLKYDTARTGVSDTFLPKRFTRHTLALFGPLVVLGFVLLAVRILA